MATKQTNKRTSAKRPVKKATRTTTTRTRTVRTSTKRPVSARKERKNSYVLSGIWLLVAGVLLAIFTYGNGQGLVVKFFQPQPLHQIALLKDYIVTPNQAMLIVPLPQSYQLNLELKHL